MMCALASILCTALVTPFSVPSELSAAEPSPSADSPSADSPSADSPSANTSSVSPDSPQASASGPSTEPPTSESTPIEAPLLAPVPDQSDDDEPFDLQPPAPSSTTERTPALTPRRKPRGRRRSTPVWGQGWLTASLLGGLNRVGLGVGVTRMVLPRFGVGIEVDDQVVWEWWGAYNLFQLTPRAIFMLLPYHRVTPIVRGGFGGSFFSHQLGVYGRWIAGAGLMFAIGESFSLGVGSDFEGLLPESRFYRNFECVDSHGPDRCHRGFSPWISFGVRM